MKQNGKPSRRNVTRHESGKLLLLAQIRKGSRDEREIPHDAGTLAILLLTAGMLTATEAAYEGTKKEKAEKVSGKVIEVELEKEHGTVIWEVKTVTPDGKVTATHIDADSGSVIETKVKN